MKALQKLKLLATQCTTSKPNPSPTTSPAASPSLCRRRTLRRLLSRASPEHLPEDGRSLLDRHTTLKDLLVSPADSPPAPGRREWRLGFGGRRGGVRLRSGRGLRCRLLRRAWRPVLVAIPE